MRDASFVPWGWEGFIPESSLLLSSDTLLIRLAASAPPRCDGCGASCCRIHDCQLRRVTCLNTVSGLRFRYAGSFARPVA